MIDNILLYIFSTSFPTSESKFRGAPVKSQNDTSSLYGIYPIIGIPTSSSKIFLKVSFSLSFFTLFTMAHNLGMFMSFASFLFSLQ